MREDLRWHSGNQTIAIDADTEPGLLMSGAMEVFVVDQATGERSRLFSIEPGGPILPLSYPRDAGWSVIAVTLESSSISREAIQSEWAGIFASENWLAKIAEGLARFHPVEDAELVTAGGLILAQGQRIAIEEGLGFVRLDSGPASLSGVLSPQGALIALAPGLWLEAVTPEVEWTVLDNASDEIGDAPGILKSTLQVVVPQFLNALREAHQRRDSDAALRLGQRRSNDDRARRSAVAALVEDPAEGPRSRHPQTGDALMDALAAVAHEMQIPLRPATEGASGRNRLRAIADASGFRTRVVQLSGTWWRAENGPLLGYRKNGNPVALLPTENSVWGASRYELFDPALGLREPLDQKLIADLRPEAHVLYRPLPKDAETPNIVRRLLSSRSRDLRTVEVGGVAAAALAAAMPLASAVLIGQAVPAADHVLLWQCTALMIAAAFGSAVFLLVQALATLRLQTSLFHGLQTGVWDRLLQMSPKFFRRFTVGQLRLRADAVSKIHQMFTADALRSLLAGSTSVVTLGVIFWYSPALGLIALACGSVALLFGWFGLRSMFRRQEDLQTMDEGLSGLVLQVIGGLSKLRVAGALNRTFLQWATQYGSRQRAAVEIRAIRDRIRLVNLVLPHLGLSLSFLWLLANPIGLGGFLASIVALTAFLASISSAGDTSTGLVTAANLWQRTRTILSGVPEVQTSSTHPGKLRGEISLEEVTFRYRENGNPVLDRVSIHARPGECIAVTGPSGSGKSTLLNLILRFESPQSGGIFLDGRELSSLDISAVRRQMGVVTQDARAMAGSILQNICAGGVRSMDEAWAAARAAGLAEDIEAMPMGMHTRVSDGGGNLSGGQRQRLLIARALVLKPSILIFDEATSALDNRTQAIVSESLKQLKATRILVAHRLSTLKTADRIYVLEKGRITQQGTYSDLVKVPGLFARLVERQAS